LRKIKLVILFLGLFLLPITVLAQNISDYLILQNIGSYEFSTQSVNPVTDEVKQVPGYTVTNNSGILMGTDHFFKDHNDKAYETDYESDVTDLAVEVQVTQHTGGDSDRWLLHEIDKSFRTSLGIPGKAYGQRTINGQSILESGAGGRTYRWISGNKIINIEYTDAQMTKREPLEVVQAYLTKHPSTIASMTLKQLRSSENVTKWIKDEMDRRLWLCDKWNVQYQTGKTTQADLIYNLDRSMGVFLNYRQKYYGVSAKSDLEALFGYKQKNDVASIQKKLTEYKTWWAKHKGKNIKI
jgi:hypothetical protein